MKRLVMSGLITLLWFSLFAQDSVIVDTIVVNAHRKPIIFSRDYKPVQIITREQIKALNPSTITDLLDKLVATVDLKYRGSGDVQADISVNGSGFNDVLILLNGVRVNDFQTGHFNLVLPVSPEMIDHIEVLTGPDARKYGLGAYSGVINIVTGIKNNNVFSTTAGIYEEDKKPIVSATFLSKDFNKNTGFIGAQVKQSQGYTQNTDYELMKLFYQGGMKLKSVAVDLQMGLLTQQYGALNFYTPKFPYQHEKNNQEFISALFHFPGKWQLVASWRRMQDRFELFREGKDWYQFDGQYFIMNGTDTAQFAPGVYYQGHNYHANNTFDLDLLHKIETPLGRTYLEVEAIHTYVLSTVLGDSLQRQVPVPFEQGIYFTHGASRTNFVFTVDHVYQHKRLTLSAGGSLLYNNHFGFLPGWGLDLSYGLGRDVRLFTGFNQSMRMPTFTELYYHDPVHKANPHLKPEQTFGYQAGLRWTGKRLVLSLTPFYSRYFNKIDWVWDSTLTQYISYNFTTFDAYGLSGSCKLDLNLLNGLVQDLYLSYSYLDYRNFSFAQSKYTANLTHLRANGYVDFSLWRRKQQAVVLTYSFVYKQRFVTFFDNDVKNIFLSDLKFSYLSGNLDLIFSVQNLFNAMWYDYYTPMPGRTYYLTMKIKF